MEHQLTKEFTGEAVYQITVNGKVDPKFMKTQNKLKVTHTKINNNKTISTLTGGIVDESALNGLLNLLYDYQYNVISVMKLNEK